MKHPKSTITNLSYIIAGLIVMLFPGNTLFIQTLTGIALIALAVGSTGYHWGWGPVWQKVDMFTIYMVFFFTIFNNLSLMGLQASQSKLIIITLLFSALILLTFRKWDHDDIGLLGLFALAIFYLRAPEWAFVVTCGMVILAMIYKVASEQYIQNDIKKYDNLHAVWHIPPAIFFTLMNIPY